MDIVLILRLLVLFGVIFFGIRLGGMAIGYTGGLGVIILTVFLGMNAGAIPTDVILIIMSVIAAITALQKAGGLDYMVRIAERILRNNPKHINFLAPTVTYVLTVLAGTGHTAFAMIPVIVEVAKEQNVKPAGPLSMAVVSGQVAITASPVSAAVVYMTGVLEPYGWSYPTLLVVWLLTTYVGCMIAAFIMSLFFNKGPLDQDPDYLERVKAGLIHKVEPHKRPPLPATAKASVIIFITGVICVVLYATMISDLVRLPIVESLKASDSGVAAFLLPAFEQLKLARDGAIMSFMLLIATLIVIKCKLNTSGGLLQGDCRPVSRRALGRALLYLGAALFAGRHRQGLSAGHHCGAQYGRQSRSGLYLGGFLCRRQWPVHPANLSNLIRCGADGRHRYDEDRQVHLQSLDAPAMHSVHFHFGSFRLRGCSTLELSPQWPQVRGAC